MRNMFLNYAANHGKLYRAAVDASEFISNSTSSRWRLILKHLCENTNLQNASVDNLQFSLWVLSPPPTHAKVVFHITVTPMPISNSYLTQPLMTLISLFINFHLGLMCIYTNNGQI